MERKEKIVYTAMVGDLFHVGHLNILKEASKLGKLIVGVVCDETATPYKRSPLIPYEERAEIIRNIKGVWKVEKKEAQFKGYVKAIEKHEPDYVVHGDDWKGGFNNETREALVEFLKHRKTELIEIPYTRGISTSQIINNIKRTVK